MERRCEERIPAGGAVELEIEGSEGKTVKGDLVDLSTSGFRVRHNDLAIRTGMRVRFSHADVKGFAVVAWTRVAGKEVESGFYIPDAG